MRKNLGKWLLVWPPQAYLLFFFLVPALIMLFASFRFPGDYGGLAPWMYSEDGQTVYDLSVENYTRLTESWVYLQLFVKSFGYALVTTLACLLLAYPVATTLARAPAKWRNLLILLVILPFWSNLLVRVYAWMIILSPSGALTRGINATLDLFGAQPISLMFTPFAVILCMVYVHLPFMILPLYANLEKHDPAPAGRRPGPRRRSLATLLAGDLPASLPGVAAGAALVFIPVLGMFAIPDLVGGTDGIMIGNLIKSQFLDSRDWPFGSALSIALTGCILLLVALGMGAARARKEAPMRRPYLLWSATALVYLFLYVPLVIVVLYSFNDSRLNAEWVGFTLDWYRKLFGNRDMLQAAANSLVIALVSASVATLLGTLAGVALHRFKLRVLPLLVLTPIAIPELLMGVSLVIFFIGLNMSLGMLSVTLAHITFSVGFCRPGGAGAHVGHGRKPHRGGPRPRCHALAELPPGDPAADHAGHRRRRADGLHPVHRRLRDHLLHRRRQLRHPADADLHHDQDRRDARSERRLHPADAAHPGADRDRLETLPSAIKGH